jgi:serine/threonine protein kinase
MGTPAYMAPEQIRNAKDTDTRADIFALGCILYELVCHQQAFDAPDLLSLFNKVASGDSIDPLVLQPDLPRPVVQALRGSMEVERDVRIQNVEGLRSVLNGERTWTRPTMVLHADGRASAGSPAAKRAPPTLAGRPELAADSKASFGDVLLPDPEPQPTRGLPWGRIAIGVGLVVLGIGALSMAATGALGVAFWQTTRVDKPVQVRDVVEPPPVDPQAEEQAPSVVQPTEPSKSPDTVPVTAEKPPAPEKPSAAQGGKVPTRPVLVSVPKETPKDTPKEPNPLPIGTVTMTGADSIVLTGVHGYRSSITGSNAASVPAGTYTVSARWGGHASGAGEITVTAGKTVKVVCDPDFMTCEAG